MRKFLIVLMIVFMVVLYFCGMGKSLTIYACEVLDKVEILVDDNDTKLIKIDVACVDDFVESLNLQNYSKFEIEDRVIIEGYSNKLSDYIITNNKKINVQMSISKSVCLVGSPLIKNSF